MPVCAGLKRKGGRCTATVEPPLAYCWWHDPARAEERRRNASRAGKSKPPTREIAALKGRISDVVEGVLSGELDKGAGAVAIQGLNALRAVLALEREIRETEELARRIEELERGQEEEGSWAD